MLFRLATLGAIGYVGYKYLSSKASLEAPAAPKIGLAGGPLSAAATLQHADELPAAH